MPGRLRRLCLGAAGALCALAAQAYDYERDFDATEPDTWPVVAVIIDDLGDRPVEGRRAVALPGPVACSVLPHTPYARELARTAHLRGKEVLLHQPLEADSRNQFLGPGAITGEFDRERFSATLRDNLAVIPHVSGLNNHMGSRLTRGREAMRWLMSDLKKTPLFFVDSRTTEASVAYDLAREMAVPAARRDVFLDHDPDPEHVAVQWEKLKREARRHGYAVAIGHPHPVTLQVLEAALPRLAATGYRLVTIRELIDVQSRRARAPHSVARHGGARALPLRDH